MAARASGLGVVSGSVNICTLWIRAEVGNIRQLKIAVLIAWLINPNLGVCLEVSASGNLQHVNYGPGVAGNGRGVGVGCWVGLPTDKATRPEKAQALRLQPFKRCCANSSSHFFHFIHPSITL